MGEEAAIAALKETVMVEIKKFDTDGNYMINKNELGSVMKDTNAQEVFHFLGVDVEYMKEVHDMLFEHSKQLPVECVMEMMLMCRSSLPTTFRHLAEAETLTRLVVKNQTQQIMENIAGLRREMQTAT